MAIAPETGSQRDAASAMRQPSESDRGTA
jgi:hypothetical protein